MFYFIKRTLVWIRRLKYSRGFGVQSPWAYRFIRYVVNEHYPYYKYRQLEETVYGLDRRTRKLCRFYFRLSNYQQPVSFIDFCPPSPCYKFYVTAGARRADYRLVTLETLIEEQYSMLAKAGEHSIVRVSLENTENLSIRLLTPCLLLRFWLLSVFNGTGGLRNTGRS